MKTERRHELQTNVLADWLGHKTEAILPYSKLIVGGAAVALIIAMVAVFISNEQFEQSARGWADYFAAASGDSPDRLRSVAEDHAGTLPGLWAMQREADLELARGIRALYTNRGEATEALAAARKLYELVDKGALGQPDLRQAALFGLAQAYEAEGDVEKAKDNFDRAAKAASESALAKQAKARLERLEQDDVSEFLAWFDRQTPQPRAADGGFPGGGFPGGGFPGGGDAGGLDLPRDLTELPGRPDVSVPTTGAPTSDRGSALPTDEPAAAPEGASDESPASDEPPGAEPDGKKAAETAPAETTPAETSAEGATAEGAKQPAAKDPVPSEADPATPDAEKADAEPSEDGSNSDESAAAEQPAAANGGTDQ